MDDCEANRRIVTEYCTGNGINVLAALDSATDIIQEYERLSPDVVIMDYLLPGKDGFTATRKLITKYPKAKVVIFTAAGFFDDMKKAEESGAIGFVQKPFSSDLIKLLKGMDI